MKNSGFVLLNKPSGMTSRQAGGRVARMFGTKKFGHLGTLDPMASGVLPIALGEATKMIPYIEMARPFQCAKCNAQQGVVQSAIKKDDNVKEYEFSIQWGVRTDTDDITGAALEQNDSVPTEKQIAAVLPKLVGEIWQTPPAYSAVHIGGKRAYELARAGTTVEIPPRKITIYSLEIIPESKFPSFGGVAGEARRGGCYVSAHPGRSAATPPKEGDLDRVCFRVRCSAGTYVRTITQDIARLLNRQFIATTSAIRRTRTHNFSIKDAVSLDFLENLYNNDPDSVADYLKPIDFGLDGIPVANLEKHNAELFQNGGFIAIPQEISGLVRAYENDRFIGVGFVGSHLLKPDRVIKS